MVYMLHIVKAMEGMTVNDQSAKAEREIEIPDGESMWEDLGRVWNYEDFSSNPDGEACQLGHPVCTAEDLDGCADDRRLARRLAGRGAGAEELDATEEAVGWARSALSDMRTLAASLVDAVEAAEAGDRDACLESLGSASRVEREYGDDPATRDLRRALADFLDDADDEDEDDEVQS